MATPLRADLDCGDLTLLSVCERVVLCPPVTLDIGCLGAHRLEDGCGEQLWSIEQHEAGCDSGDDGGAVAGAVIDKLEVAFPELASSTSGLGNCGL